MNTVAMATAPSTTAAAKTKVDVCGPEVGADNQGSPLCGTGNQPPTTTRRSGGDGGDNDSNNDSNSGAVTQKQPEVVIRNGVGAHGSSKRGAAAVERDGCGVQELASPAAGRRGVSKPIPPAGGATVTNSVMAATGAVPETPEVSATATATAPTPAERMEMATADGDGGLPEVVRHRKQQQQHQRQMMKEPVGHCQDGCGIYVVNPVRLMNNRALPGHAYVPTKFEHIANMVTHGLIIVPAMLGLCWMLSLTTTQVEFWAALVYGAATLALFVTSTTFHTLCYHTERAGSLKDFFHYGDRAIIYIFIAASYTPWLILKEFHAWETFTLWLVWIMAAAGILYQYQFHERYKFLETLFYIIIGVCPSIIIMAMKDRTGLYEMAIGGVVYMIGVIFFKSDGLIPFAHAIWHCFVFVGVVFHYVAVCKHLLGNNTYPDISDPS